MSTSELVIRVHFCWPNLSNPIHKCLVLNQTRIYYVFMILMILFWCWILTEKAKSSQIIISKNSISCAAAITNLKKNSGTVIPPIQSNPIQLSFALYVNPSPSHGDAPGYRVHGKAVKNTACQLNGESMAKFCTDDGTLLSAQTTNYWWQSRNIWTSGVFRGGRAGSAPPPLSDGLTPSHTVHSWYVNNVDRYPVKHGTQNILNDCHPWLSDDFRVNQIHFPAGELTALPQTPKLV